MVRINGKQITMVKGDTVNLQIKIKDSYGNDYNPVEGDVVRFAMKKSYYDTKPAIIKVIPNDTMILTLEPDDTKDLASGAVRGRYVYDIEITMADGTVDTFIPQGTLTVLEEVH